MRSAEQVTRILALVPYLLSRPGVPVAEAATAFGVSVPVLTKDLETISLCGTTPWGGDLIDIDVDEDGIFCSNASYLTRPLRLTPDEALSLALALRAVGEVSTQETGTAVRSALAKLEAMAGVAAPEVAEITVATGAAEVREVVASAVEARRRLRLTYDGGVRAETTTPVVDPLRVAIREGRTYLDAWSLERGAWRMYRLDRIVAAEPTGERAEVHADPPPAEATWLERLGGAAEVVVSLSAQARWVVEYTPVEATEPDGDGLRVTLRVADPAWLRTFLLRLGGEARVVSPGDAGVSAAEAAREALDAYRLAGWQ